ncbi:MAG: hypothetical protein ACLU9S_22690 [Oscillospiraceae bacterium]
MLRANYGRGLQRVQLRNISRCKALASKPAANKYLNDPTTPSEEIDRLRRGRSHRKLPTPTPTGELPFNTADYYEEVGRDPPTDEQ